MLLRHREEPVRVGRGMFDVGHATVYVATDLEGKFASFLRWMATSGNFYIQDVRDQRDLTDELSPTDPTSWTPFVGYMEIVSRDPAAVLVHNGDTFDGPDDELLSNLLCDYQEEHPDRCFLLLGNRDINKGRFGGIEYGDAFILAMATNTTEPRWTENPAQDSFAAFLAAKKIALDAFKAMSKEQRLVCYVQWQESKTMGIRSGLSHTIAEMERLGALEPWEGGSAEPEHRKALAAIEHRRQAVHNGHYSRVNRVGLMACLLNGSVLFVHGALTEKSLQWVFGEDFSIDEWIDPPPFESLDAKNGHIARLAELKVQLIARLNETLDTHRGELFVSAPRQYDDTAGAAQIATGVLDILALPPSIHHGRTVVCDTWSDSGELTIDPKVAQLLILMGVKHVFTGHRPQGEEPRFYLHQNQEGQGLVIVNGDTTYARSNVPAQGCVQYTFAGKGVVFAQVSPSERIDTQFYLPTLIGPEGYVHKSGRQYFRAGTFDLPSSIELPAGLQESARAGWLMRSHEQDTTGFRVTLTKKIGRDTHCVVVPVQCLYPQMSPLERVFFNRVVRNIFERPPNEEPLLEELSKADPQVRAQLEAACGTWVPSWLHSQQALKAPSSTASSAPSMVVKPTKI